MIRQLLYSLFVCDHPHQMKVRDDQGRLLLECLDCHNVAEVIQRTKAERRQMAKRWPTVSKPKAQRVVSGKVEPMRRTK